MNVITLKPEIYQEAEIYAQKHNISLDLLIEKYILGLLQKNEIGNADGVRYRISPRVKALEMGFKCPSDLSLDYKKERKERLGKNYL